MTRMLIKDTVSTEKIVSYLELNPDFIREGFIRKKKIIVNFHNLGPDPPKSCERQKFIFFHTLTETHFGEKNFFSPYKSIKLRKISRFFPNISKIFGLSGKGVPPPPILKFFFFADLHYLGHERKKIKKCENDPILS